MIHCIPYLRALIISHHKKISQRHLAMKVLEPIHLHTADLVQACQHFLDLFTCRSQMFLSVQSFTEAGGCTFPKHFLSKPIGFHWSSITVSLLNDWHSQQGSEQCWRWKGKAWILRLVVRTLYFGASSYIFTDDTSKNKMATDDKCVTLRKRVTLAELGPGRLNLKGHCHDDFAVLGQFCAKIITLGFNHK